MSLDRLPHAFDKFKATQSEEFLCQHLYILVPVPLIFVPSNYFRNRIMFPPLQVVQELYDEASLSAVLQEWYRTFADLPFFMRQSVQLGLFSSAQLVRFLCMDVRPGITRQVTRTLSPKVFLLLQTACCDSERLQELLSWGH